MNVWYASYGSNLCRERFDVYLRGGRFPGNEMSHPGARDASPPTDVRWWTRPGQVRFAEFAPQWGGAVAFLDPTGPSVVHLACYLITDEQFDDVVAQESGRRLGEGLRGLVSAEQPRRELGDGWYETLWHLGTIDGVDVVTFTCARPAETVPATPSEAYLRTIVLGLAGNGMGRDDVANYLLACPGVMPGWDASAVRGLVATV